MTNILETLPVGVLLRQENNAPKYRFLIPSYQRGYRWDDEQVEDLLNDIYEFIYTKKTLKDKYCLQPVVVKKLADGRYEVLDGQQRLTTIFLLLTRLKQNNDEIDLFSLAYETRPNSATFLQNLDLVLNKDNPDYYYMSNAFITINEWLKKAKEKKANINTKIFDAIVESIEFIWYEITESVDAIDVFTRINVGKIPLTNAELVKAVFLSKNNLSLGFISESADDKDYTKILSLKQNAIALEWDQMEKALQEPQLWGFIYNGNEKFETRIDYLLNLYTGTTFSEKHPYASFKYFYDRVKEIRADEEAASKYTDTSFIERQWSNLKELFDILLEWYHDKTYNHLIGFLIAENADISKLIADFKRNKKSDFLSLLKRHIKGKINCTDISILRYGSHNAKLNQILLLHNVINSLEVKDANVYFPFHKFKGKAWTLEHVFAQNSDELREEDYEAWLQDHLPYFQSKQNDELAKDITLCISDLLAAGSKKIEREDFQSCFIKIRDYIQKVIQTLDANDSEVIEERTEETAGEYEWMNDDHSIANLALLDGSINSAIKNSLFDIKRRMILERDKAGLFVPTETKMVFLKYYTKTPAHLAYWTFKDRKAYVENINRSLTYLT
ncbi:DUF262 domain-containing protein [Mucilaginibacter conchicola]|uniref:DUF262 domain-containing protein n=1 Tax=Mucilaginibacter conchicola TaxID=2303333 RepID=A0A372NM27_9SPHI|nr:DUF262 domain-containing protein [Mucilaginibacter conchicola]RFZ90012.1 DUF262 domain-containing protein [Mucilaginibacter conchicola]